MKILKNKNVILAALAVMIVFALGAFQSCSNEMEAMQGFDKGANAQMISTNLNMEFLDLDISSIKDSVDYKNLTENQKSIIKKALDRIDPYVVCENKLFHINLDDASEIRISNRLFKYAKSIMNHTNDYLKKVQVTIDKKNSRILHVVINNAIKNNVLKYNVRFKSDATENNPQPVNTTDIAVSWRYANIYISNADLNAYAFGAGSAGALGMETGIGVAVFLSASAAGYYASQNPNCIILHFEGYAPFYNFQGVYPQSVNNNNYFFIP